MGPSNTVEEHVKTAVAVERPSKDHPVLTPTPGERKGAPLAKIQVSTKPPQNGDFPRSSMLENNRFKGSARSLDLFVAVLMHAIAASAHFRA